MNSRLGRDVRPLDDNDDFHRQDNRRADHSQRARSRVGGEDSAEPLPYSGQSHTPHRQWLPPKNMNLTSQSFKIIHFELTSSNRQCIGGPSCHTDGNGFFK